MKKYTWTDGSIYYVLPGKMGNTTPVTESWWLAQGGTIENVAEPTPPVPPLPTVVPGVAYWGSIQGTLSQQTDLQDALDSKIAGDEKGAANGIATLGSDGKVPESQLSMSRSITAISSDVDEYTLSDGVFQHQPFSAPVYTLPDVIDNTRTHVCVLTVRFSASAMSCVFQDAHGNTLVPRTMPTITAFDVVQFTCRYEPLIPSWVITGAYLGEQQEPADNAIWYSAPAAVVPYAEYSNVNRIIHRNYDATTQTGEFVFEHPVDTVYDWFSKQNVTSIKLPKCVTAIGTNAFAGCLSLVSINLPEGLQTIGDAAFSAARYEDIDEPDAFMNAMVLSISELPNTVTTIGSSAFAGCQYLALTSLPSNLVTLGSRAFMVCSSIQITTLPSTLHVLEFGVFIGAFGLTAMTIPSTITSIEGCTFASCINLSSITFLSPVTSIPVQFASATAITSFNFPYWITEIEMTAFAACSNLKNINTISSTGVVSAGFPSNLTTISDYAFIACSKLEKVAFNSIPTSISETAFQSCDNLWRIDVPWAYGTVAGANVNGVNWGAPNAVVNYKDATVPICFYAIADNSTVALSKTDAAAPDVQFIYSYDNNSDLSTWSEYTLGTTITLSAAQVVYFRTTTEPPVVGGYTAPALGASETAYHRFSFTGSVGSCGNANSLLFPSFAGSITIRAPFALYGLFKVEDYATDAVKAALKTPPILPGKLQRLNTTLTGYYAYKFMFMNNTGLRFAPELLSTTIPSNSCHSIFINCTSLREGPSILPCTALSYARGFYAAFANCYELRESPRLDVITCSGSQPLESLFYNCTNLSVITLKNMTNFTSARHKNWVYNVCSTGTFYCKSDLGDQNTISRGPNYCPVGWTVINI